MRRSCADIAVILHHQSKLQRRHVLSPLLGLAPQPQPNNDFSAKANPAACLLEKQHPFLIKPITSILPTSIASHPTSAKGTFSCPTSLPIPINIEVASQRVLPLRIPNNPLTDLSSPPQPADLVYITHSHNTSQPWPRHRAHSRFPPSSLCLSVMAVLERFVHPRLLRHSLIVVVVVVCPATSISIIVHGDAN